MLSAIIVILLALVIWLVSRKLNGYKNEPVVSLGLDLDEQKWEKRMRAIEKQVALRRALDKGLDPKHYTIEQLVEQYNEAKKEEGIEAAMKEFSITREEAIVQGFDKGGQTHVHLESRVRKESKRLGREISMRDLYEIDRDSLRNSKYPGPDCWEPWEIEPHLRGKKFPPERVSHLNSCIACHCLLRSMAPDPEMQKPPGPDCITKEELDKIEGVGILPPGRHSHLSECKKCKSNVHSAQERFIKTIAPDPSPWGFGALD